METTILQRSSSVVLAIMVLFSTLSFTVEKHYCAGKLVDLSVFSKAETCGMEMPSQTSATTKSCCKDEVDVLKGQDHLKTGTDNKVSIVQTLFIKAYVYCVDISFESLPKKVVPHLDYSPPNIVKDIHVLDETFLI